MLCENSLLLCLIIFSAYNSSTNHRKKVVVGESHTHQQWQTFSQILPQISLWRIFIDNFLTPVDQRLEEHILNTM